MILKIPAHSKTSPYSEKHLSFHRSLYKRPRLLSVQTNKEKFEIPKNKANINHNDIDYDPNIQQDDYDSLQGLIYTKKYPIITYVSLIVVVAFCLYTFYKFKTRPRIKRSLFYHNKISAMSSINNNHKRTTWALLRQHCKLRLISYTDLEWNKTDNDFFLV